MADGLAARLALLVAEGRIPEARIPEALTPEALAVAALVPEGVAVAGRAAVLDRGGVGCTADAVGWGARRARSPG